MNTEHNNSDNLELSIRYFTGEATDDEVRQLEEWVSEKPGNRDLFLKYKRTWQLSAPDNLVVDREGAWNSLLDKIGDPEKDDKAYPFSSAKSKRSMALRIAAVAVLVIVSAAVLYFMFGVSSTQELVATAEIVEKELDDGSTVTLNTQSRVTYLSGFTKKKRQVSLLGSAFFEVAPDENRPFVVETSEAKITVLGTSFLVNAREEDKVLEVIVRSGKVRVTSREGKSLELTAGEQAVLHKESAQLQKEINTSPNYLAWKTNTFIFEDARLEEVVRDISNNFHVDIILANGYLADCRLTATYQDYSVEDMLELIAETLNLTVSVYENRFVLDGPDC